MSRITHLRTEGRQPWLRLLLVLALALAAFAHRPALGAPGVGLAAYTLPDGTVPQICFGSADGGETGDGGVPRCEHCRLSAGVTLPAPAPDGIPLRFATLAPPLATPSGVPASADGMSPFDCRGPPHASR